MEHISDTQKKKNASQFVEELEATGQEDETKAAKWIIEKEKNDEKVRIDNAYKDQEVLHSKRRFKKNDYFESLLTLAKRKISEYDIPNGYRVDVILEQEEGALIFGLQKVGFRWYAKGMKICGEPKYDINCVERLVVQQFIALDELEGHHDKHRTKSGIILPNSPSGIV